MIITAIKCDQCKNVHEVKEVPKDWATIGAVVRIRGISQSENRNDATRKRRAKLASLFKVTHICPDCVELMLTGNISTKIEAPKNG